MSKPEEWMTLGKLAKRLRRTYRTVLAWVEVGRKPHGSPETERVRLRVRQTGGFLETTVALYEEFNNKLNEGLRDRPCSK